MSSRRRFPGEGVRGARAEKRAAWLVAACIAIGLALCGLSASAQPAIVGQQGRTDDGARASIEGYVRAETARAEAAAQQRLADAEAAGDAPSDAPAGTPSFEIAGRLAFLRQLVSVYPKQQNALQRLEIARQRRADVERAMDTWRGFEGAPPRSVLLVDALREELDGSEAQLRSAGDERRQLEKLEAEFEAKVKSSQGEARLAAEAADRGRGSPASARLEWRRNLTALAAEVDSSTQTLVQLAIRATKAEYEAAVARRDFAHRKLIAAGQEMVITIADLGKIHADIEARRVAAERALDAAKRNADGAQATFAALAAAQTSERGGSTSQSPTAARLRDLDHELLAAREVLATADQRVFLLRDSLNLLQGERTVWEARAQTLGVRDVAQARGTYERLNQGLAGLRATRQYYARQLADMSTRVRDEEARVRAGFDHARPSDQLILQTLHEREADLRQAIHEIAPIERLVLDFRADFDGQGEATLAERSKDVLARVGFMVRQIWNYEMFTIDDTFENADGHKIPVSRSVTVGKTFGAVLILVLGYLSSSRVVRWIERRTVASKRATPQGAALVRKWILFAVAAGFTLFALLSASIPLTAFAFLGGALALAAGFGLQTLLKNLVSGVMLLLERPMRLNDLVEVDGIRGRITEIGLRASTIRSADGTESMVPNSRFLEGNMTNWTYSAPATRHTVTVGVAYGSPLRKVHEVLNEALERHGQVLKDPAPQVYLDAYGDNSINFTLTYWVEMIEGVDSRRVKSDVLHMIDRSFAQAGIAIPFPQRDVHLTSNEPVQVAIVRSDLARAVA